MGRAHAIETSYAGCRFRSRLEARWAVFFDALGVDWVYEPQGFEVGEPAPEDALEGDRHLIRYLPDFWLPGLGQSGLWAEVKGELRRVDLSTLCLASLDARGGLPFGPDGPTALDDGGPFDRNQPRLLILTNVPRVRPNLAPIHWWLRFHKGDVVAETCTWMSSGSLRWEPLHEEPVWRDSGTGIILPFTTPLLARISRADEHVETIEDPASVRRLMEAYAKARSARFEFGQTPVRR